MPASRILAWTRRGLIEPARGPRGAYVYSFQDLVLLRAARDLLSDEVPVRKVREALTALRRGLPSDRPLSALTISAIGRRVLVRDEDATWEADSGQFELGLPGEEATDPPDAGPRASGRPALRLVRTEDDGPTRTESADEWYDRAVDLEGEDVAEAMRAYRRAIDLDPGLSDAHLNLGRLLHETGDVPAAREEYLLAIRADDSDARAHFNLGVALEDQGASADALEAYAAAVERDETLAVAHFNLARLLEERGRGAQAIRHLVAYRRLALAAADE